jgi:hypothetical protein
VHTIPDEYQETFKEYAETPTVLSGRGFRDSRLLAPSCDVERDIRTYMVLRVVTQCWVKHRGGRLLVAHGFHA